MRLEHWLFTIPLRLRSLLRRRQVDLELDEELQFHLEQKVQDYVGRGFAPSDARYAGLRDMDGLEQRKEECRDTRRLNMLDSFIQDVSHGLRMFRKNPGFTAVVILTLALGIGASTAIFSIANAVLLRPLPYRDARQLVRVWGVNTQSGNFRAWASYPNLEDWRRQNTVFTALGASREDAWTWTGGIEPRLVDVSRITPGFLAALEMRPTLGRAFSEEEYQSGHAGVVILSHRFWESRLGANPAILGRRLTLDEREYTVVGVLPGIGFPFPPQTIDAWVPLPIDSSDSTRGSRNLNTIARLRRGVSLDQAQAEMSVIASRLERLYPDANAGIGVRLEPLQEALVGDSRRLLAILIGVVLCVLLIACFNVTNLMLSRTRQRAKEIAVRLALGAGRGRVIRQLLTESLLLSACGGALGCILAAWGIRAIGAMNTLNIPRQRELGADAWVLLIALILSILPGLLIGLLPALHACRPNLAGTLKEGSAGAGESRERTSFRGALVIAEVSLSLVLLTGASLLLNSLWRLVNVQPGFQAHNVLTLRVSLSAGRYPDRQHALDFYQRSLDQMGTLSGVQATAIVSMLPLGGGRLCNEMTFENRPIENADCVESRSISPGYFDVMKIPLLEGRRFSDHDSQNAPLVILVNETLLRSLGEKGTVVGKRVFFRGETRQIVGVVGDVHQLDLSQGIAPEAYLPLRQQPLAFGTFVLKTSGNPESLAAAARRELWALDRNLLIYDVLPMETVLERSVEQPRLRSLILVGFADVSLVLAALGLGGLVSYSVSQRMQEFGIRLALGARPSEVRRLVIAEGMRLAITGIVIGLAASLWLTRFLAGMLFGVKPIDAVTFCAAALILLAAALLASLIPAQRAMSVDPLVVLRYE